MPDRRQRKTVAQNFWYTLPLRMNLAAFRLGLNCQAFSKSCFRKCPSLIGLRVQGDTCGFPIEGLKDCFVAVFKILVVVIR